MANLSMTKAILFSEIHTTKMDLGQLLLTIKWLHMVVRYLTSKERSFMHRDVVPGEQLERKMRLHGK